MLYNFMYQIGCRSEEKFVDKILGKRGDFKQELYNVQRVLHVYIWNIYQ